MRLAARLDAAHIGHVLLTMGYKADAGETAAFTRQLEYVKTKTYDIKYAALKARKFIPVDSSVPTGAESFVWRAWDWAGMADIISNYADDLPKVDAQAAEVVQIIKSLGASYGYTIQDLRASAFGGTQLDTKRASAARRSVENKIEQLAAKGNAAAGLPGFINNANVPLLVAGGAIVGSWKTSTPSQVLADLNAIANSIVETTKEVHTPDTLILPTSRYSYVATTPMSVNDNRSILEVFLQNSPYIKYVDQWQFLDTGDAAGTGPRAICYERSNEVLELVIPQEFEQFPPQPQNLAFNIPCHARIGGVSIRYPLAIAYADGI